MDGISPIEKLSHLVNQNETVNYDLYDDLGTKINLFLPFDKIAEFTAIIKDIFDDPERVFKVQLCNGYLYIELEEIYSQDELDYLNELLY